LQRSLDSLGETNAVVGGVKDRVVVLQELLSENESQSRLVVTEAANPGVGGAGGTSEVGDLVSGDQVLGRGQGEGNTANGEGDVLQLRDLARGDGVETRVVVELSTRDVLVQGGGGGGGEEDQSRTSVNNTVGGTGDLGGTVGDLADINTPVLAGGAGGGDGNVGDGTRVLGGVNTSEGDLSVGLLGTTISDGSEEDTDRVGRDLTSLVQVVGGGGDVLTDVGDGREIIRSESDETLDTSETVSSRGNSELLGERVGTDGGGIGVFLTGGITRAVRDGPGLTEVIGGGGLGGVVGRVLDPEIGRTSVENEIDGLGWGAQTDGDQVRNIGVDRGDRGGGGSGRQVSPTAEIAVVEIVQLGGVSRALERGLDRVLLGSGGGVDASGNAEEEDGEDLDHCGRSVVVGEEDEEEEDRMKKREIEGDDRFLLYETRKDPFSVYYISSINGVCLYFSSLKGN